MSRVVQKIGTSVGLVLPCSKDEPEQIYVSIFKHDEEPRSILIENWYGYNVGSRMEITNKQAQELVGLLVKAVALTGGPL